MTCVGTKRLPAAYTLALYWTDGKERAGGGEWAAPPAPHDRQRLFRRREPHLALRSEASRAETCEMKRSSHNPPPPHLPSYTIVAALEHCKRVWPSQMRLCHVRTRKGGEERGAKNPSTRPLPAIPCRPALVSVRLCMAYSLPTDRLRYPQRTAAGLSLHICSRDIEEATQRCERGVRRGGRDVPTLAGGNLH